ncbi:hypothetical protein [Nitrogeniibacter aestuarii]|uniref:hypothetical protein n=1 Tax=Nitrogeniibacter aestuarii TaxID=2815343 RepID=UPI001D112290|nr:hypothetical protein [Nitrogeniibacter aestuarii]
MDQRQSYTVFLPDWEYILPKLCSIIEASYQVGDFASFEDKFLASENDEAFWSVPGDSGCELSIKLEKYEGYLFGTLNGVGNAFASGAQFLWESYLSQGGNPEAQESPTK